MAHTAFVAFASSDSLIADTIAEACKAACTPELDYQPWNGQDASGRPIDRSVHTWIENADSFVADISEPNANVTYEIGLAIGMGKPIRLIRAATKDRRILEQIGLLHNLGHDTYNNRMTLTQFLGKPPTPSPWPQTRRNRDQPIYYLQPTPDQSPERRATMEKFERRVASAIKKILRLGFRNFNTQEIDRLTATEAFEQVSQSFGIVATWTDLDNPSASRQNQRAAFAIGLARGMEIPFLLLAHHDLRLPLDLDEVATRWRSANEVDAIMREFRDEVDEARESYREVRPGTTRFLDLVHCGDPAAENEATQLDNYFLETEQFRLTYAGDLNIILGRKGSGKTAIFLQARDRTRNDKNNIVVDLHPESFQLIRLKEFVLNQLSYGTRKEFIAAFWEYIVWLEIAYKLLEKDKKRLQYDSRIMPAYDRLRAAYVQRIEGSGDFAERLAGLTDRIVSRYEMQREEGGPELSSSKLLEVVYGSELRAMRDEVLSYLKIKGLVFFLFDNLDRFWTPAGFGEIDALIIVGLIESLLDIRRRFARSHVDFRWVIFIRSDVYEFVVKNMSDYGKLKVDSAEWNDRELLARMFQNRVLQGFRDRPTSWGEVWNAVSVQTVDGRSTLDFIVDASLMRPRYLIRLFETARRRAVTLGKDVIDEQDYRAAFAELGWQVLEDFDRELSDVIPYAEELMFDIAQLGAEMSLTDLRKVILGRVSDLATAESAIDVLIWTGCIGVRADSGVVTYISDCGFKRPFMRALMRDERAKIIVFHPTLAAIVAAPKRDAGSD